LYNDRYDAGEKLAELLAEYKGKENRIIAIPNGGVPVGASLVRKLGGKLSLLIVRKLQIPYNPEAGFGAVTMDGTVIFNKRILSYINLTRHQVDQIISKTRAEIYDRMQFYHIDYSNLRKEISNKTVILTDDGLASGFTMIAAIKSIKNYEPDKIIVAVPTTPKTSFDLVSNYADQVICSDIKDVRIFSVASAYKNWYDLDKDEVLNIINELKAENLFF